MPEEALQFERRFCLPTLFDYYSSLIREIGGRFMSTSAEQLIEHLKHDIAALEQRAKRAESMLPHLAEKYHERWKASIDSTLQQAKELSALLVEIRKDHPGN